MRNFKIIIEYDGAGYHGWQRQKNQRTIQQEIETALSLMTRQTVKLTGSGRTDAGVHALGQTANFKCDTKLEVRAFQAGLNSLLDKDIVIKSCVEVPETFHARYDAISKLYRYRIFNRQMPSVFWRQYAWFIPQPLNINAMQTAALSLIGEHDFKSFEGAGTPKKNTVRQVYTSEVIPEKNGIVNIEIKANGFLRYMVRNITGALVYAGLGKITHKEFHQILTAKNRTIAPPTAPPHGLYLVRVSY